MLKPGESARFGEQRQPIFTIARRAAGYQAVSSYVPLVCRHAACRKQLPARLSTTTAGRSYLAACLHLAVGRADLAIFNILYLVNHCEYRKMVEDIFVYLDPFYLLTRVLLQCFGTPCICDNDLFYLISDSNKL